MKQTHEHPICPQCQEPGILEDGSPAAFCLQCRFPLMAIANKYRLDRLLARGGSGTVYLARHLHLDDAYARVIKVLEMSQIDDTTTRRFYREVQVTARAANASDHIVRIYDDFGHEPFLGYYYVMEYLQGEDLGARLSRVGRFDLPTAIGLFAQLCEAMSAAHDVGVIHRDLKPENILLVPKGEVEILKVIDFGIARKMNTVQITDPSQSLVGTPLYMSPEQCLNQAVDHRADIYAMGLILFELLTGDTPFAGAMSSPNSSLMTVMYAHIHKPPPRLSVLHPELAIPMGVERVIDIALSKDPSQRFESVEMLSEALLQALQTGTPETFDSRATIPDDFDLLDHIAEQEEAKIGATVPMISEEIIAALTRVHEGQTEVELEAFAAHETDEVYLNLSESSDIIHSLDVLPGAGARAKERAVLTPKPQTPPPQQPLASSFPLNPLPSPPTVPAAEAPALVEQEQILAHAEALVETRHLPEGAQQFGALEAMAPQLWALHDEWHQEEPVTALRAILALYPVVQASGDVQRFLISLRSLLKQPGLLPPALRLKALLCQSSCHKLLGQWDDAARVVEDTLAMTITRDAPRHKGQLLNLLGSIYRFQGKRQDATGLHQEALSLLQQQGDQRGVAKAHRYLANLARGKGDMKQADSHLRASLQLCRQVEDRLGEGETLGHLGNLYRSEGRKEEAEGAYKEALVHYQELGDQRGLATTRSNLGHVLMKQGQLTRAAEQYEAAIDVFRAVQDRRSEAIALGHLGDLHRRRGELAEAKARHQAAMALHRQLGDRQGEAISYNHLGATLRDEGRFHEAAFHHEQAAACQANMQDDHGMGMTRFHMGLVHLEQDQLSEANERFDEAMALLESSHALEGQCGVLLYRGVLYHLAGGIAAASECYLRALGLAEELRDLELEARVLLYLVMLEAHRDTQRAQAAHTRAEQLTAQLGPQTALLLQLSEVCLGLAYHEQDDSEVIGTQPQMAWDMITVEGTSCTDQRLGQRLLRGALQRQRKESESNLSLP